MGSWGWREASLDSESRLLHFTDDAEYSTCNAGIGEYKSAVEVKGAYFGEE
jgi:hypothetical protein